MRLTVGIDARKVRDYGIGRYLEGILGALARQDGDERYVLFTRDGRRRDLPGTLPDTLPPDRFAVVACDAGLYSAAELFAFRGAARAHSLDVLHFPHYVRGLAPGCPVAVTIHDPIHLIFPPSFAARIYARGMMEWSARSAAELFTVSRAAAAALAGQLRIPAERFRVTPNGVGPPFTPPPPESVERFRREHGLEREFVLAMASHRPHKNLRGAIQAFTAAELPDADLVVPARDEAAARALAPFRAEGGRMRVLTGVTDAELPRLYAAARVVLIPSLFEGFGLPGLEAAACGAAVVATGIAAHREVLGDAALLTPSGSPGDLADALRRLWNDPDARTRLRAKGPARAAEFPWERGARATLEGYRAAAQTGKPLV